MAVFCHDEGGFFVHVGLARQLMRVHTSGRIYEPRNHIPLLQLSLLRVVLVTHGPECKILTSTGTAPL